MVSWILHMSDLHLGKNPALERERLLGLAKWLEGQEFGVDHLVFTGDLIDAPTVLLSCVRKLKREYPDRFSKLRPVADTDAVLAQVEAQGRSASPFTMHRFERPPCTAWSRAAAFSANLLIGSEWSAAM